MPQRELFDLPYEAQQACATEIARLKGQVLEIWNRLLEGPATNKELAALSLKYTSRVSNLREVLKPGGFTVECFDQDKHTGVTRYRLARLKEGGS